MSYFIYLFILVFFYIQIKINMKSVVIYLKLLLELHILKLILGIKYIKSYSWNQIY